MSDVHYHFNPMTGEYLFVYRDVPVRPSEIPEGCTLYHHMHYENDRVARIEEHLRERL